MDEIEKLRLQALEGDSSAIKELVKRARQNSNLKLRQENASKQQSLGITRREKDNPIDPLTQIPARKSFFNAANREQNKVNRARKNDRRGVVIQIDLEDFKKINDGHGHDAGDEALMDFADKLRSFKFRKNDVIARVGGDEFAILLTDTTLEKAEQRIKKLNKHIKNNNFIHEPNQGDTISISYSTRMGVFEYSKNTSLKNAISLADKQQITIQRIKIADRKARGLHVR